MERGHVSRPVFSLHNTPVPLHVPSPGPLPGQRRTPPVPLQDPTLKDRGPTDWGSWAVFAVNQPLISNSVKGIKVTGNHRPVF